MYRTTLTTLALLFVCARALAAPSLPPSPRETYSPADDALMKALHGLPVRTSPAGAGHQKRAHPITLPGGITLDLCDSALIADSELREIIHAVDSGRLTGEKPRIEQYVAAERQYADNGWSACEAFGPLYAVAALGTAAPRPADWSDAQCDDLEDRLAEIIAAGNKLRTGQFRWARRFCPAALAMVDSSVLSVWKSGAPSIDPNAANPVAKLAQTSIESGTSSANGNFDTSCRLTQEGGECTFVNRSSTGPLSGCVRVDVHSTVKDVDIPTKPLCSGPVPPLGEKKLPITFTGAVPMRDYCFQIFNSGCKFAVHPYTPAEGQ